MVGIEGVNIFPSFWECVVEDPDIDIIIIDPDSPSAGIALLKDRLCKNPPNGYDIKITEVKPNDDVDANGNGYNAYIEVLNRGAPAPIMAGFGTSYSSSSSSIGTGEYLLARDTGGSATTASTVPSAQRVSLPTSSPTVQYFSHIVISIANLRRECHYYPMIIYHIYTGKYMDGKSKNWFM